MVRLYLRSPNEVSGAIGARARELRKARRITQIELADRAGIGRSTVQRFENSGDIGVEAMVRIAFALGVPDTFDELFPAPAPKSLDDV